MTDSLCFARILLVKPSSLGDVIHALPVLHGLRQRYPKAHIAWLVSKPLAPLIRNHPELDEVIEFDRRLFRRLGRSWRVTREFLRWVRTLRAKRFDLAVDLQGLFRSGFLSWASGASTRFGFRSAREWAGVFYTHRVETPDPEAHAVDKNYLFAPALGFEHVPVTFDLGVTDAERARATDILTRAGVEVDAPFVAVLPGARWETKRWGGDRFAAVIVRLAADHRLRSVLIAAPEEAPRCAEIVGHAARAAPAPVNLAGRTGLRDLVALLERAAVVVCQDSAPSHVAAALGRPVVCIFGPTNPRRTGPYQTKGRVLQADIPCAPCYRRSLRQCPYDHECMRRIDADAVVEAATGAVRQPVGCADAAPP
jgi:heptosyltransferase-1